MKSNYNKEKMRSREPRDTETIAWTKHVQEKMRYYNLSAQRIKRILRHPERVEEGIAPRTIAAMQKTRSRRPSEVWLMYQITRSKKEKMGGGKQRKIRIISAWRYPGQSPAGQPPIPEDVLELINNQ